MYFCTIIENLMKPITTFMVRVLPVAAMLLMSGSRLQAIHAQTGAGQTAAAGYTVSGYVVDGKSGETLPYATVFDTVSCKGVTCNEYGFFSFRLPGGKACLSVSYVGYQPKMLTFAADSDRVERIPLEQSTLIDGVTIVGNRLELGVQGSQMSAIDLPVRQIKAVPAMFGEVDVLKALQLLPGVQGGTEGTAGLLVRGGNPDENLLMLDGVPLYNVNHMFGLFSVFNADAIKNVTLYKGSFPARYCGRLSSVVDVRMKDGDLNNYHGNVSIGLISSKINVEGPIVKGKTSFNVSLRRTYSDIVLNAGTTMESLYDTGFDNDRYNGGYGFYDLNLKLTHKFNDNDRLFLSWYNGDDDMFFKYVSKDSYCKEKDRLSWKWGNLVAAARWNHVIDSKLFMDLSANHTRYRHLMKMEVESKDRRYNENISDKLRMNSGIYDWTLRSDFHYTPKSEHEIRFGAYATHHLFRPDVFAVSEDYKDRDTTYQRSLEISQKDTRATELQFYAEDNLTVNSLFKVNAGLSYSLFNVGGRTYNSLEPRLSGRMLLSDRMSVKLGYAYMTQYIHLLSNNSISLPTDLWVPATNRIEPEHSSQYAAGLFYTLPDVADFSIEGYYKDMDNLLEYMEGASYLAGSTDWQNKVVMGRGWSYGVEFLVQRSFGKFDGWVSYTWGHARRQFDRPGMVLNGGRPFDAKYDRRHDFKITGNWHKSDRFDVSATWIYQTGACSSLYTQYYDSNDMAYGYSSQLGYYGQRNSYRLNPYHRLDLSMNWHRPSKWVEGGTRTFNISVFNAYNNRNPFLVYVYEDGYWDYETDKGYSTKELRQVTLFPILPTMSLSLSF